MSHRSPTRLLVAANDLIFETRIRSTAQSLGVETIVARSPDEFLAGLERHRPRLVFADLNSLGPAALEIVGIARATPAKPRIIAYVSHVDVELAGQARQAGADQVLPRSRFVAELPRLIAATCATSEPYTTRSDRSDDVV